MKQNVWFEAYLTRVKLNKSYYTEELLKVGKKGKLVFGIFLESEIVVCHHKY